MTDYTTVTVTNTDRGPRGCNPKGGGITLLPGESRDVEMSAPELAVSKAAGWFDFSEPKPPEPTTDEFDAMSDDDLRAKAAEIMGRAPHANTGRAKLLEIVRKAAADDGE